VSKTFIFPQGGGGAWLSNLIHNLETGKMEVPTCQVDFDHLPRGSIPFSHRFIEHNDQGLPAPVKVLVEDIENNVVFSNCYPYNHYLNDIKKLRYNLSRNTNIANLDIQQQWNDCVNSAVYLLTNELYRKSYYDKIDLDHDMIFKNPESFVDKLFTILDNLTEYRADKSYVLTSCGHYRTTCASPADYTDNQQSLSWLAWVAGVVQVLNLGPDQDISTVTSIEDLSLKLRVYRRSVLDFTDTVSFTWKKE